MTEYKVGDKVRCIDNKNREDLLKLNKIYIIIKIIEEFIILEESNQALLNTRFEPAYIKDFDDKLNNLIE